MRKYLQLQGTQVTSEPDGITFAKPTHKGAIRSLDHWTIGSRKGTSLVTKTNHKCHRSELSLLMDYKC